MATEEAEKLGQRYVQNEHVLVALVQSANSYAAQLLKEKDISLLSKLRSRKIP
jgi:ATP-dependent Clp protease ATP-binding subunit ClpA